MYYNVGDVDFRILSNINSIPLRIKNTIFDFICTQNNFTELCLSVYEADFIVAHRYKSNSPLVPSARLSTYNGGPPIVRSTSGLNFFLFYIFTRFIGGGGVCNKLQYFLYYIGRVRPRLEEITRGRPATGFPVGVLFRVYRAIVVFSANTVRLFRTTNIFRIKCHFAGHSPLPIIIITKLS